MENQEKEYAVKAEFENLCGRAVACRSCFEEGLVAPSLIDLAQPRWVGPKYAAAERRVVAVMLNPGSGESRKDGANERFRKLIRDFANGSGSLDAVLGHQSRDMVNWNRGRFLPFYTDGLGLRMEAIAFANVAWCGTRGNKYPVPMLEQCFARHTGELIEVLKPDIVLLSGSRTHRFAQQVRQLLPGCRVIPMLHYAHRKGRVAQIRELQRARGQIEARY
ncbi:MAG: hypothetical protein IBX61_07255 [Thermoleophilia bacterium]|nr:hypothetical protein [Thermoleophilia bacterium]